MSEQLENILNQISELKAQRNIDRQRLETLQDEIVKLTALLDASERRNVSNVEGFLGALNEVRAKNVELRAEVDALQRTIRRMLEF